MSQSSELEKLGLTRRSMLFRSAIAMAAAALNPWHRELGAAAGNIRLEQPGPGTAGAVWRPLIEKALAGNTRKIGVDWIGGDPGQAKVQLLAGASDISFYGPISAAEAALRGIDVVLIAPGLNNHGSWIVRGDSAYRSPRDLRGKKIATQPETTETYRQARVAAMLNGIDLKNECQLFFGPPTANWVLFERGDVDGVITIEPISTRLVAAGAREIARVKDMWQQATGDTHPLILGGQAAMREWFTRNRGQAEQLARLYTDVNQQIRSRPQILAEMHQVFGIPDNDRAAIELLPKRLADTFAVDWDQAAFAVIDHEIDVAVKTGILKGRPPKPVYDVAGSATMKR